MTPHEPEECTCAEHELDGDATMNDLKMSSKDLKEELEESTPTSEVLVVKLESTKETKTKKTPIKYSNY